MNRLTRVTGCLTLALVSAPAFAGDKKGDADKGKELFQQCAVCHNADSTEKKIGPGLKGVKDGKLPSGKPATHDAMLEQLNTGGGAMPPYKDLLTDEEKDNVIAYVMTL